MLKSLTSKENRDLFICWIYHSTVFINEKNNALVVGFFDIHIKYFVKIKPKTYLPSNAHYISF